jgi:hypothetical protein
VHEGRRPAPANATTVERIPVRRLNAYLRPRRSDATCRNGGPHSGYRHLADKDEAGGSSPPRPTTKSDQQKCWSSRPAPNGRDGCRIKNTYLVTAPRHSPDVQHCCPRTIWVESRARRWLSSGIRRRVLSKRFVGRVAREVMVVCTGGMVYGLFVMKHGVVPC